MANKSLSLLSVFRIGLLALVVIGSASIGWLTILYQEYREIGHRSAIAEVIVNGTLQILALAGEYLLYQEPRMEQQWRMKYKSMIKLIDESQYGDTQEYTPQFRLRRDYNRSRIIFERLVNFTSQNHDKLEVSPVLNYQRKRLGSEFLTTTQFMTSQASLNWKQMAKIRKQATQRIALVTGVTMLSLVAAMLVLWWILALRVIRPVNTLSKDIKKFGNDLNYHVNKIRNDEIGNVAASFNIMATNLRETLVSKEKLIKEVNYRKNAEEKLISLLGEKEVLLKEVHHRVKNNLQVISSMLSLQAKSAGDDRSVEVLAESQRRIRVMARIHENLHKSDNLASIDTEAYLDSVVEDTFTSIGHDKQQIFSRLNVDSINLDVDQAVACGQIISELLSNSLKHAFPNGQIGNVETSLHRGGGGKLELAVVDDGVGLPENFDVQKTESLGLKLVHALAMQLSGEVHINGSGGTNIRIIFPENSA